MFALLDRVVSLALPPRCPACGAVAEADHRFCTGCWTGLTFIGPPWCAGCAIPFDYDRGADARCASCLAEPPLHAGARAAVAYGEAAKTVVLRLKYARRTAFAETAARAMARHVPDDAQLIVPVPLHRWRLWSRGYNQAALIARGLASPAVPAAVDLLRRSRATPVLRGLGRRGRARAVAGAFTLADGARARLAGRHVVLVDDVFTTGATANACTRVLLRGGATKVTVLCWARVIGEDAAD